MAADSSFDIVSKLDHAEIDNAINQTQREVSQRFDFKNTGSSLQLGDRTIELRSETEGRLDALPPAGALARRQRQQDSDHGIVAVT